MFEQFPVGAPAHPASSTSCNISPCGISPPSPPPRLPASDPKQKAPSNVTKPDSRLDELNPQQDEISSSFLSTSLNPLDVSEEVTFLQTGFAVDRGYENDVSLDFQPENAAESRESSRSSSTLRVCRRLQRQLNSHLLYTHSQLKAVSELLEQMVSTESQCNVTTPSVISQPETGQSSTIYLDDSEANQSGSPYPINDEGYFEGDMGDNEELDTDAFLTSLRRAAAPSGVRRHAEGAVYSKPRMRRNIMKRRRPEAQPGG